MEKLAGLTRATLFCALHMKRLVPKHLQRLMGNWTWLSLVCREFLSIGCAVYAFMRLEPENEPVLMWDSVRAELLALAALGPLARAELWAGWGETVFMTDSSEEGHGTVMTEASREEVIDEARFAECRGWTVTVDEWYTCEEAAADDTDEQGATGAGPYTELAAFAK